MIYDAAIGVENDVRFTTGGPSPTVITIEELAVVNRPAMKIRAGRGCTASFLANRVTCGDGTFVFTSIEAKLGNKDDRVQFDPSPTGSGTFIPAFVKGQAGDDVIFGTRSNDRLFGNAGHDVIRGDSGSDRIDGDLGDDKLFGDQGGDILQGNLGRDELTGGPGRDALSGGDGQDKIFAEDDERDNVQCGSGADQAQVDSADVVRSDCEDVAEL